MDKVTVQSAPADGTVLLPRGSTDARAQSDTRSGLEGWTGGPEEPITGQDPCIVRPPSHLKMQGVLNLDPSCLVFLFLFFFSGNLSFGFQGWPFVLVYLLSIRFCSGPMTASLREFPRLANTIGNSFGFADQEISGDLLSISCGTGSLMEYTSCSVYVHQPRVGSGKGKCELSN